VFGFIKRLLSVFNLCEEVDAPSQVPLFTAGIPMGLLCCDLVSSVTEDLLSRRPAPLFSKAEKISDFPLSAEGAVPGILMCPWPDFFPLRNLFIALHFPDPFERHHSS